MSRARVIVKVFAGKCYNFTDYTRTSSWMMQREAVTLRVAG